MDWLKLAEAKRQQIIDQTSIPRRSDKTRQRRIRHFGTVQDAT